MQYPYSYHSADGSDDAPQVAESATYLGRQPKGQPRNLAQRQSAAGLQSAGMAYRPARPRLRASWVIDDDGQLICQWTQTR